MDVHSIICKGLLCFFGFFPIKNNKVVFSSYYGKYYSDNPMYIFEAMAQKTVLKLLLSKQAPLSIVPTLADAVQADQAIIRDVNGQPSYEYADNQPQQAAIEMDISNNPELFNDVKTSVQNGNLDKAQVLSGQAGYIISDQQRQELVAS